MNSLAAAGLPLYNYKIDIARVMLVTRSRPEQCLSRATTAYKLVFPASRTRDTGHMDRSSRRAESFVRGTVRTTECTKGTTLTVS